MINSRLRYCFLFLLVSFISTSFIQEKEPIIYWTTDFQLTWDDFWAKPQNNKRGAISCVNMGPVYHFDSKNSILEIDSRSCFDKTKSWSKKDLRTNDALKHEQGHFDIAEIFARRCRKEVNTSKFKQKNVKKKIEAITKRLNLEFIKYQDLYDKETDHHRNESKQSEWNLRISKELEALSSYEEPHLSIKVK